MVFNAYQELSPVELEHLDELISREIFGSDRVMPFSTCSDAVKILQGKLLRDSPCEHVISDKSRTPITAEFMHHDVYVTATCHSATEAVAAAGLVFHRRLNRQNRASVDGA